MHVTVRGFEIYKGHLDAVAQEAALSKGGVLYHFPTKRD